LRENWLRDLASRLVEEKVKSQTVNISHISPEAPTIGVGATGKGLRGLQPPDSGKAMVFGQSPIFFPAEDRSQKFKKKYIFSYYLKEI